MIELIQMLSTLQLGSIFKVVASVLVFLSIFIEISPIKFNPLSALLKWVGRVANGELTEKVNNLETQIGKIQYDNAKRSAVNCRVRILRFGDELRQGQRHSKESFEQVLDDIDVYNNYCREHPEFKNNKTCLTTKKIIEEYQECMDNNDFL